ncbi:MAG: Rho termination factor N-terminal domain-containing protein [Sedimentisphaerales bacterium]
MVFKSILSKGMGMPQIRAKAKNLGVDPGKMKKTELIHAIQNAEGFVACFRKADGYCPQETCCFRDDCLER